MTRQKVQSYFTCPVLQYWKIAKTKCESRQPGITVLFYNIIASIAN